MEAKNKVRRYVTEIKVNPMMANRLMETLSTSYELEVIEPHLSPVNNDLRGPMNCEAVNLDTIIKVYEVFK
ncbi:hypothetical protein [Clostridium culturomicium]|uniref:hypothetical protein n=1 Tax=Clostridium culturomicium TaxID=1499683 RepID=UPI003857E9E8